MIQFGNITNSGKARISSPFGPRNIGGRASKNHKGIDLSYPSGTQITSPLDGVIEKASPNAGNCGGIITINHGEFNGKNIKTKYCHVKKIDVSKGDQVKKGEVVGLSGGGKNDPGRGNAMGAHIHFEVLENGVQVNPKSYYENSISGEQTITQSPDKTQTNDGDNGLDDDGSDGTTTSTGAKGYKEIAKSLIKKLFGVENDVTPDVVNEIVEELYRYNELINENSTSASTTPVSIVDGATQSSANGGTVYTSNKTTSDIRAFSPGGNIEVLSEKAGYQNAVKIGGKYEYYWNGTNKNLTTISANGVIGTTSDGKVFVKAIGQSVIPLKPGQSGSQSSTTTNTNPYRDSAKSYTAGVLNTLINGKQQTESVKKDFDKILEEEVKNFKRLIR
jgi:hypothetical protein